MVVNIITADNKGVSGFHFGKKKPEQEHEAYLMKDERKKHPVSTALYIQGDKLFNAFTTYPQKGLKGSKNANFYEYLTMGMVPYLVGSGMLMAVFNLASRFFDTPSSISASSIGKRTALGVIGYGLAKTFSKKLIEVPMNMKYGIDVNLPLRKKIDEIPENGNNTNLKKYEYHKVYESADFTRWDLLYNKEQGKDRNEYFKKVGKKMGLSDAELETGADQKVKPLIKEKVIKSKLYSMISSYLWAASAVGVAMQNNWDTLSFKPSTIIKKYAQNAEAKVKAAESGIKAVKYSWFRDFGTRFVKSCKDFVCEGSKAKKYAGRALFGAAVLTTAAGIFSTLNDFNINRGKGLHASTPLFDESKEKVVC